jgi:hypothetical protein
MGIAAIGYRCQGNLHDTANQVAYDIERRPVFKKIKIVQIHKLTDGQSEQEKGLVFTG